MSLLEASLGHYRDILNNGSSDPGVLLVNNIVCSVVYSPHAGFMSEGLKMSTCRML